jgi:hypothetical protein
MLSIGPSRADADTSICQRVPKGGARSHLPRPPDAPGRRAGVLWRRRRRYAAGVLGNHLGHEGSAA